MHFAVSSRAGPMKAARYVLLAILLTTLLHCAAASAAMRVASAGASQTVAVQGRPPPEGHKPD
jgi:hypothetical protein